MANLIRRAKSGNDWTAAELDAYNITIEVQDAQTFFGVDPLPEPHVDAEVLDVATANAMANDANYHLLCYMDLAMSPIPAQESAVDDFAVVLLRALGYQTRGRSVCMRRDIQLVICGEQRQAKTDVCILDDRSILLLMQEDKRHMDAAHPEPQLIAEVIAAFQTNNTTRRHDLGLPLLDAKIIPGIAMLGTSPTFYKIPVTEALAKAVLTGQYPTTPTVVAMHLPDLPRPERRRSEGMRPLDNRRHILQCFEAFKPFVN